MTRYFHKSFFPLLLLVVLLGVIFLCTPSALAAELSFQTTEGARVGNDVAIEVFLDTEQDMVNALEGGITIPSSFRVRDIRFTGSVVSLWISRPVVNERGTLTFAGLIPGGYQGTPDKTGHGNIMTLILEPTEIGIRTLTFTPETTVLLNDGEGSKAALTTSPRILRVGADDGLPKESLVTEDVEPPLAFTPQVIDGVPYGIDQQVLIFDAQDKESGIAGYEIAFSGIQTSAYDSLAWQKTESPYPLSDEQLTQYVYVRTVDMKGNFRVAVLSPYHFSIVAFVSSWLWYLLAGIVVAVLIYRHRRRLKKTSA